MSANSNNESNNNMDDSLEVPVDMLESAYNEYTGFKKSAYLRERITKILEVRTKHEVMSWINNIFVRENDYDISALAEDLSIINGKFFEDETQFECLFSCILPELFNNKCYVNNKLIRIWSPACNTGEEAYSITLILLLYMLDNDMVVIENDQFHFKDGWSIEIYGTDISSQSISIANNARYNVDIYSELKKIPYYYHVFKKYEDCFIRWKDGVFFDGYHLSDSLKPYIQFKRHNINEDGTPDYINDIDIVFCSNLMIHLHMMAQINIQHVFAQALADQGYLIFNRTDEIHEPNVFYEVRKDDFRFYRKC